MDTVIGIRKNEVGLTCAIVTVNTRFAIPGIEVTVFKPVHVESGNVNFDYVANAQWIRYAISALNLGMITEDQVPKPKYAHPVVTNDQVSQMREYFAKKAREFFDGFMPEKHELGERWFLDREMVERDLTAMGIPLKWSKDRRGFIFCCPEEESFGVHVVTRVFGLQVGDVTCGTGITDFEDFEDVVLRPNSGWDLQKVRTLLEITVPEVRGRLQSDLDAKRLQEMQQEAEWFMKWMREHPES